MIVDPVWLIDDVIQGARIMAAAGHGLMIKYGLAREPGADAQKRWASLAREYINRGMARDVAGAAAAKQIFPDFNTHVYASESDAIETLLRLAEQK